MALSQWDVSACVRALWPDGRPSVRTVLYTSLSAAVAARLWYRQYGCFLWYRSSGLPQKGEVGLPVLGCVSFLSEGLTNWGNRLWRKYNPVYQLFYFNRAICFVDWEVYEAHVQPAEDRGELVPQWHRTLKLLLGSNSIIHLRAGRGPACATHKRLRGKIMQALAPKQLLLMAPSVEAAARRMLDACAAETAGRGEAVLRDHIERFAFENAAVAALGELAEDPALLTTLLQEFRIFSAGIIDLLPLDVPFLPFGRAMRARRRVCKIVEDLLGKAMSHGGQRNVLAQLMATDADGTRGLNDEEIVDTLLTLLFAGVITTAITIPHLVVRMSQEKGWAERIAEEAQPWTLETSIEEPDRSVLKFIREVMRMYPAAPVFFRSKPDGWLDLGEHGRLPPGWPVCVNIESKSFHMPRSDEFEPDRWTPEASRKDFVVFGGHSPHSCVGRGLALLEMQILMEVLASGEYGYEVVDSTITNGLLALEYKDGLRVKVWKRKNTS